MRCMKAVWTVPRDSRMPSSWEFGGVGLMNGAGPPRAGLLILAVWLVALSIPCVFMAFCVGLVDAQTSYLFLGMALCLFVVGAWIISGAGSAS